MRGVQAALGAALLVMLVAGCGSEAGSATSGAAAGWNVVLISVDTQRADRLGGYGYEKRSTSPRTDELLLEAGARCARAMSPRGATWPAMASVLTGLYPSGHGVIRNGYGFPDDVPTLPKILQAAGYQTGAFINNMHRANHSGWDAFKYEKGAEGRLVNRALDWARARSPERPYFLWAHFFGPHSPYHQAKRLTEMPGVDTTYRGPVKIGKVALDRILSQSVPLDERDLEQLDALYDAAVLATDREIGRLIDGLRSAPGADRTLFVLTSDHGEELYDHHDYLYHACSIYQTVLHVPLAFVAPGLIESGTVLDQPVELIDVLPTVLDLLGLEAPAEQHGRSLLADFRRPEAAPSLPAFSEYDDTEIHTVVRDNWKLVINPDEHAPDCVPGAPDFDYPIERLELYDLGSDPGETTNLAASRGDLVRELKRLIDERFEGLTDRSREQDLPDELRRELEALGYVAN